MKFKWNIQQNCISFSFVINFFFNKNNTFIYKYAYTRIGTIKMILQDDSKPSIIKSMIICFSYHLWWQSSIFFRYHKVNKMDIVDWNNVHVIKYLFFPKIIVSTIDENDQFFLGSFNCETNWSTFIIIIIWTVFHTQYMFPIST